MKTLKSYNQFIAESNNVDEGITDIKGIMSNPIKYKKIKNNAKKYQQTKVQISLNNLDYEKKKQASKGELDPKTKEALKVANATKNTALKDKASAISQRMKDLATTDPLKKVVTIATTKSNLAAAETALKAADGEESKQLKIRIKKLAGKAADAQQALKDYESEGGKDSKSASPADDAGNAADAERAKLDKEKADKAKETQNQSKEDIDKLVKDAKAAYDKVKDGEDAKAKYDAEIKFKQAQQKKAKFDDNDELYKGLGNDIGEIMQKIQDLDKPDTAKDKIAQLEGKIASQDKIQTDATKNIEKLKGELKLAQDNKNTGKSSQAKADAISDKIQQYEEDRTAAKTAEAKLKKQLKPLADKEFGESFAPLEESVSQKFRRLMNNV